MDNIQLYIKESYNELVNKVTWPSWPNLLNSSILVIVASLIFAIIVFIMDIIAKGVLNNIYKINF